MAGMKSWLEKIKNRILKKDLDDDLTKSKIQSEENLREKLKEKTLPDLITPTNEEINEIQREEAIRVKEVYEREINRVSENSELDKNKMDNIKSSIETRPWWTKRSNPNR